ncbi:PaaI family thioesterase [Chitinibacteraceae bacterium HSL-7]
MTTTVAGLLERIPYAGMIGMAVADDGVTFELPFVQSNVGNVLLPALHGGVIGGFMETAAIATVMVEGGLACVPKIIDFSIDYLRSGRPQTLYARCDIVRQGNRIANVAITAWQDDPNRPVAQARAHFLLA